MIRHNPLIILSEHQLNQLYLSEKWPNICNELFLTLLYERKGRVHYIFHGKRLDLSRKGGEPSSPDLE